MFKYILERASERTSVAAVEVEVAFGEESDSLTTTKRELFNATRVTGHLTDV